MSKHYPKDEQIIFMLCDDLRQEQGSKLSLLGLFIGGDIVISESSYEKGGKKTALPSITFFYKIDGGEGVFENTKISLFAPSGETLLDEVIDPTRILAGKTAVVAIKYGPFVIQELGLYKTVLTLDDKEYVRTFDVNVGEVAK